MDKGHDIYELDARASLTFFKKGQSEPQRKGHFLFDGFGQNVFFSLLRYYPTLLN